MVLQDDMPLYDTKTKNVFAKKLIKTRRTGTCNPINV